MSWGTLDQTAFLSIFFSLSLSFFFKSSFALKAHQDDLSKPETVLEAFQWVASLRDSRARFDI